MSPAVSLARLFVAALALASVGLVALLLLALSGEIPWGAAIAVAVAMLVGLMWRLRRPMQEAVVIAAAADRLAEVDAAGTVRTPEIIEIAAGLARARALFRERDEEMARRATFAERILEALPDPVLLLDRDRRVVRANSAARELLDIGVTAGDLAGFLRAPTVLAAADAVLADGVARDVAYKVDVPVERHFGVLITPITPAAGTAPAAEDRTSPRAVVRLVDLTAVKRAEEMRADFAANASHELKTPLAALIGFIETLRGPAHDDAKAQDRFLGLMATQAERMRRLVNDLLALSSIELVEHAPPTTPVALAPIVRSVVQALEIPAKARDMRITVAADDDVPSVPGDSEQLAQLIQNLLDNAIKYGAAGSDITVRLAAGSGPAGMPGKAVAVSISDRGDGIPPEHIPRLTERFYRVDSARSREAGGTGLGLAIVKHILSRHRGQLKVDSAVGVGSTFTAYLPAAARSADSAAA
jgi:two-component system phosphate regulon sensor histidine kinase PhoR